MELITFESEVYKDLVFKIENMEKRIVEILEEARNPLGEKWITNEEAVVLLDVSKRTLQRYRDEKLLPFSKYKKRIKYKAKDIQKLINKGYKKISGSQEEQQ